MPPWAAGRRTARCRPRRGGAELDATSKSALIPIRPSTRTPSSSRHRDEGVGVGRRRISINRLLVTKPHYRVGPGDVLTFPHGYTIQVLRMLALGARRGPASEAQTLYEEVVDGARGCAGATIC